MAKKYVFLATTGAGQWTVPDDFSPVNTVHCIAGGGSGGNGGSDGAAGGGGGAYSATSNISLTPGDLVNYYVGAGGIPEEGDGEDTWFGHASYASALCGAKAGKNPPGTGSGNKTGGAGGSADDGIGDAKYSGGRGRDATGGNAGGGGGGAAGPDGDGTGGTTSQTGGDAAGGSGTGGTSLADAADMNVVWTQTTDSAQAGPGGGGYESNPGALYGGGGGGEGNSGGGDFGAQGIIVIEYEPVAFNTQFLVVG